MVAADLVRVALAGVLAVWHDSAPIAYAVAFGLSAGQVFFSLEAQSLLLSVGALGPRAVAVRRGGAAV